MKYVETLKQKFDRVSSLVGSDSNKLRGVRLFDFSSSAATKVSVEESDDMIKEKDNDNDNNKNDKENALEESDEDKRQRMKAKRAMELNDAYESLEKMRRLNLDLACQECGISDPIDYDVCSTCVLQGCMACKGGQHNKGKLAAGMSQLYSTTVQRATLKKPERCLICASPTCHKHASTSFRKDAHITICQACEGIFRMDFILDCLSLEDARERRQKLNKLMDLYDRVVLLIKFSNQYTDAIVQGLHATKRLDNKILFGKSSAGIVSGALGVAAAATIATPAGPPLLMASLLFGSSATAVQTGTEVKSQYFCEANRLAQRIIALHGTALSVLMVVGTLQDVAARDYLRSLEKNNNNTEHRARGWLNELETVDDSVESSPPSSSSPTGGVSATSVELGRLSTETAAAAVVASRNRVRLLGTKLLSRSMELSSWTGGALSAATLVLETKCLVSMWQAIRNGNACDKARALCHIRATVSQFPSTMDLDVECSAFLTYMDQRSCAMGEDEALDFLFNEDATTIDDDSSDDYQLHGEEKKEEVDERSLDVQETCCVVGDGEEEEEEEMAPVSWLERRKRLSREFFQSMQIKMFPAIQYHLLNQVDPAPLVASSNLPSMLLPSHHVFVSDPDSAPLVVEPSGNA